MKTELHKHLSASALVTDLISKHNSLSLSAQQSLLYNTYTTMMSVKNAWDDDDTRGEAWAAQPEVSSRKTTKCHHCQHLIPQLLQCCCHMEISWIAHVIVLHFMWDVLKSYERESCYLERERHNKLTASVPDCDARIATAWSKLKGPQHHTQSLNLTVSRDRFLLSFM